MIFKPQEKARLVLEFIGVLLLLVILAIILITVFDKPGIEPFLVSLWNLI